MVAEGYDVAYHLAGKSRAIVEMYQCFVALVEACGPFEYVVGKGAITFKGRRRLFAGAKPKAKSLDGFLVLQRRIEDPRILRAPSVTRRLFINHFRVTALDQLDQEFADWVYDAYGVGEGFHLAS